MKKSKCCPKCASKKLFVVNPPCIADLESQNLVNTISIATASIEDKDANGFWNSGVKRVEVGTEAYVCSVCGYTEWYTIDLDVLENLVGAKPSRNASRVQSVVKIVHGD